VGAQRRADAFDGTDQVNQGAGRASVNNTFTEEAAG
jgi:hypothetical protein